VELQKSMAGYGDGKCNDDLSSFFFSSKRGSKGDIPNRAHTMPRDKLRQGGASRPTPESWKILKV
jgi:hypothetical protein